MNIIEVIKKRKSCRTYKNIPLNQDDKKGLLNFILENKASLNGEQIQLSIFEKAESSVQMKLNYGMIKGHQAYLLGKSGSSSVLSRVNYGYFMEKAVLKATEIGLSTCWVGYFDESYFCDLKVETGYEIPSIVILGYAEAHETGFNKFVRFSAGSNKRLSWDKIFFNYDSGKQPLTLEASQPYFESLEMLRLAPSSGNTQPWRIFFDKAQIKFHFYKKAINKRYEEKGLHDVDMGIAACHFELVSLHNGLKGNWTVCPEDQIKKFDGMQYVITWKAS